MSTPDGPSESVPVRTDESGKQASPIPGTTLFDGTQAMKGYALNKMCYSFNRAEARDAFGEDEETYFEAFGLTEEQKSAVRNRNVLEMLECGGNIYYLAKLAGMLGLSVQDIGAQQTGVSTQEFKEKLLRAAD